MTDTGYFMFEGTNEHVSAVARELVLAGADPAHCAATSISAIPPQKLRLLGAALANLRLNRLDLGYEGRNGTFEHTKKLEGLVNYALSIGDVQVAVSSANCSMPAGASGSKGEINVATVAEYFGGGGHKCASGCSLKRPWAWRFPNHRQICKPRAAVNASWTWNLARRLISFLGALFILIAYVGHQMGWVNARGAAYNLMNATGSAISSWIAFHPFQIGFVVLESVLDRRQSLGVAAPSCRLISLTTRTRTDMLLLRSADSSSSMDSVLWPGRCRIEARGCSPR